MLSPVVDTIDQVRTLLDEYEQFLSGKAEGTMDAYLRTVRQLIVWMAKLSGMEGQFQPQQSWAGQYARCANSSNHDRRSSGQPGARQTEAEQHQRVAYG